MLLDFQMMIGGVLLMMIDQLKTQMTSGRLMMIGQMLMMKGTALMMRKQV